MRESFLLPFPVGTYVAMVCMRMQPVIAIVRTYARRFKFAALVMAEMKKRSQGGTNLLLTNEDVEQFEWRCKQKWMNERRRALVLGLLELPAFYAGGYFAAAQLRTTRWRKMEECVKPLHAAAAPVANASPAGRP